MPTYQYRCSECGEDLEAVQKFSDPALTECPNCGGRLRKVYNAVGVVFKGSGFYSTDNRSGSNAAKASATNGSSESSGSSTGDSSSNGSSNGSSSNGSSSNGSSKGSSSKPSHSTPAPAKAAAD